MRSLILRLLAILLAIVFAAGAADLVIAKRAGLSPIDRRALEEFQTLADTPQLWRDVDVVSHPFVLMSKDSGFSYLVTNEPVSSPFAEPIPAPAAEGLHAFTRSCCQHGCSVATSPLSVTPNECSVRIPIT